MNNTEEFYEKVEESLIYDIRNVLDTHDNNIKRYKNKLKDCSDSDRKFYEEQLNLNLKKREVMRKLRWTCQDIIENILSRELQELNKQD